MSEFKVIPSTELFPDEYLQNRAETLIYICKLNATEPSAAKEIEKYAKAYSECFESIGYSVGDQIKILQFDTEQQILTFCNNEIGPETKVSALLMIWLGQTDTYDSDNSNLYVWDKHMNLRQFWTPFMECPYLLDKAKINIFNAFIPLQPKPDVQIDSVPKNKGSPVDPYESPAQADILIIYQKIDLNIKIADPKCSHLNTFCESLQTLSARHHITSLPAMNLKLDVIGHHPVVISTLTRKFYLQEPAGGSEYRCRPMQCEISELIGNMQDELAVVKKTSRENKATTSKGQTEADGNSNGQRESVVQSDYGTTRSRNLRKSAVKNKIATRPRPPWRN